jgi:hypothetical protein
MAMTSSDFRAARSQDRPGAAGAGHRRLRNRLGHGELQPRPVRQAAEPGPYREGARDLSLWDKKDSKIMALSGGMKRRVMIAKALSHEARIPFSRRAHRRRRRGVATRHVEDGRASCAKAA